MKKSIRLSVVTVALLLVIGMTLSSGCMSAYVGRTMNLMEKVAQKDSTRELAKQLSGLVNEWQENREGNMTLTSILSIQEESFLSDTYISESTPRRSLYSDALEISMYCHHESFLYYGVLIMKEGVLEINIVEKAPSGIYICASDLYCGTFLEKCLYRYKRRSV